jgi:hypothetical protein
VESFTILQPLIAEDVRGARTEGRASRQPMGRPTGQATGRPTRVWCVVGDDGSVGVYSDAEGERTAHAEGRVVLRSSAEGASGTSSPDWAALSRAAASMDGYSREVDAANMYSRLSAVGLPYGPSFRLVRSAVVDAEQTCRRGRAMHMRQSQQGNARC